MGKKESESTKKSIVMYYMSHHFQHNNKNRRCPEFVMDLIGELLVDLSLMCM